MPTIFPNIFAKISQYVVSPLAILLFKFFGRLEVVGRENLEAVDGQVILAGGHRHELDVVGVTTALLGTRFMPMYYVSMAKNYYKHLGWHARIFYGGPLFKLLGAYPVYKGTGSLAKSLTNHDKLIEDGRTVIIYPEGRLTRDGSYDSPRAGVGYLMAKHKLPIVPFTTNGLWNLSMKDWLLRKGKITVVFGPAIYPQEVLQDPDKHIDEYRREEMQAAANLIMQRIVALGTDEVEVEVSETKTKLV